MTGSVAAVSSRRGSSSSPLASLLCSVATTLGLLIVFRMLQAVGGSMLNPVAMGIIRNVFTDPRERAQALGVWGATVGISLALGPVLGGVLVDGIGWRSIFWINVPIGILAFFLTMRFVPESRAPRPRRLDPVGQVLVIVMLASLTYAIIAAPKAGWTSAQTLGLFALSAPGAARAGAIRAPPHRPAAGTSLLPQRPVLERERDRRARRSRRWARSCCSTRSTCRRCRGLSALHAGLLTLPIAACTLVFSPLSGRILGRRGPRLGLLLGGIGMGLGGALMSPITRSTPLEDLLPAYLLFGAGFGMVNPPITNTAIIGMPAAQAGVAAAIASTSRQVGQTLGVAISGAIAVGASGLVGPGFIAGSEPAWWLVAGCGAAVLVLALTSTTRRAQASAERVSQELRGPGTPRTEAQPAGA